MGKGVVRMDNKMGVEILIFLWGLTLWILALGEYFTARVWSEGKNEFSWGQAIKLGIGVGMMMLALAKWVK